MDADLRRRLLDEGWEERFSASGSRLQETADYYRSLGYEVRIEGLADVAAEDSCTTCFAQPLADGPTGVIFTRVGAAPFLEEEELFGEDGEPVGLEAEPDPSRKGRTVSQDAVIRPMKQADFEGIVAIDSAITAEDRSSYYERKFRVLEDPDVVNMCLVAEVDGKVVGFIMGDMFAGEYGIPEHTAVIDTIGIHPAYRDRGLATALFGQFKSNLRALNVRVTYVLVNWGDWGLSKFLERQGFVPSHRVNLELKL